MLNSSLHILLFLLFIYDVNSVNKFNQIPKHLFIQTFFFSNILKQTARLQLRLRSDSFCLKHQTNKSHQEKVTFISDYWSKL